MIEGSDNVVYMFVWFWINEWILIVEIDIVYMNDIGNFKIEKGVFICMCIWDM